ncbi:MAG: FapA family protein [Lachnospiraceae bacterium]|nr:FapA family protein [Lachnospiraceae bacterium]
MSGHKQFLSEDEIAELRKEMEEFYIENDEHSDEGKQLSEDGVSESKMLKDIVDEANLASLTIEENGSYVKIAEDDMCAWLYLMPPSTGKEDYTKEELLEFLKKNGIKNGYHQSNLAAMVKKHVYEREIIVAQGEPAIDGHDGFYEYKFDPEHYKSPKVLANGNVDYTSMSSLQNVRKGDLVAVYHHAKIGKDGYDVRGRILLAKKAKEISPLKGQAVYTEENPDIYLAAKDGKIELKDGRIDIQTVHEINGDVTLITGKIEFYGDIVITGNVEAGVVIRAGRNIEIRGTVEAVNLFAGGDIILSRGIQGAQRAKISARGNVLADFIEHTVVMAGGDVRANTILNSRISADGNVLLTGNKGTIIGGYTHAMMGITAIEIGNEVEMRTVIHVGCEKETYTKLQQAKSREKEQNKELKELSEKASELIAKRKALHGNMPGKFEKEVEEVEERLIALKSEMEEERQQIIKLEKLIAKGQGAEINVNGNIYRGAVVGLGQVQMPIEHTTCYMKYFQHGGMIETNVIAYS